MIEMRELIVQIFFLGIAVGFSLYFYYAWHIHKNDLPPTRSRKSGGGAEKRPNNKREV